MVFGCPKVKGAISGDFTLTEDYAAHDNYIVDSFIVVTPRRFPGSPYQYLQHSLSWTDGDAFCDAQAGSETSRSCGSAKFVPKP